MDHIAMKPGSEASRATGLPTSSVVNLARVLLFHGRNGECVRLWIAKRSPSRVGKLEWQQQQRPLPKPENPTIHRVQLSVQRKDTLSSVIRVGTKFVDAPTRQIVWLAMADMENSESEDDAAYDRSSYAE